MPGAWASRRHLFYSVQNDMTPEGNIVFEKSERNRWNAFVHLKIIDASVILFGLTAITSFRKEHAQP